MAQATRKLKPKQFKRKKLVLSQRLKLEPEEIRIKDVKLEGKYFAFVFYADYTEDAHAVSIFQVLNGKLEENFHPWVKGWDEETMIEHLLKINVRRVYTLKHDQDKFLDFTLHWNNENGWGHYDKLPDHYYKQLFEACKIKLVILDNWPIYNA